jgi:hypothetical protein
MRGLFLRAEMATALAVGRRRPWGRTVKVQGAVDYAAQHSPQLPHSNVYTNTRVTFSRPVPHRNHTPVHHVTLACHLHNIRPDNISADLPLATACRTRHSTISALWHLPLCHVSCFGLSQYSTWNNLGACNYKITFKTIIPDFCGRRTLSSGTFVYF